MAWVEFIPDAPGGPVIHIDERGFFYKGELIEDAGKAHSLLCGVVSTMQKDTVEQLKKENERYREALERIAIEAEEHFYTKNKHVIDLKQIAKEALKGGE